MEEYGTLGEPGDPSRVGTARPESETGAAPDSKVALSVDDCIVIYPPFRNESEKCWLASLPALRSVADSDDAPRRSIAALYEAGLPLGPAHSEHAVIRSRGAGAFSHWKDDLYFSTSDGSDPNNNGRTYELVLAVAPQAPEAKEEDREELRFPPLPVRARYYLLQKALQLATPGSDQSQQTLSQEIATLERQVIQQSGRFDREFYERAYGPRFANRLDPVDHFVLEGHSQGLLASPHFDPVVYKLLHPVRCYANPLIDCIMRDDEANYRDVASLFRDIGADAIPLTIRYEPGMREEWTEKAETIQRNRDRSGWITFRDMSFELRNPSPDVFFARLREGSPFCFARFTHGFWDDYDGCVRMARRLKHDVRCNSLTDPELFNLAARLLGSTRMLSNNQIYEGFFSEIHEDLASHPRNPDLWTAVSLKGMPTFDDGLLGFNEEDVANRVELLARYFRPSDVLYDAMIFKRWAISGDLARLPEAVRDHPVIVLGPPQFGRLGHEWGLERFCHVQIPINYSHLIRTRVLEGLEKALENMCMNVSAKAPVVFFQIAGELSYWMMRRLCPRYPNVYYIDLGQALDLWAWNADSPWSQVYGDKIRSANPTLEIDRPAASFAPASERILVSTIEETTSILRSEYLDTDLVRPRAGQPILALAGELLREGTHGWQFELSDEMLGLTDNDAFPRRSPLVLVEDGRVLGAGHDNHAVIFESGRGCYCFWKDRLYFSTSDNSDPNTNGRKYEICGRLDYDAA